jgi:hypothetical protein
MTDVSQSQARETLNDKLAYLNQKSPTEIANYLYSCGINGRQFESCKCPVANWLLHTIDWASIVQVTLTQASAYPDGPLLEGPRADSAISMKPFSNVTEFINRFDVGYYQFLIDKS